MTISQRIVLGPLAVLQSTGASGTTIPTLSLNDADNLLAMKFAVPKTGSITQVGFWKASITGTPPAYRVGVVVLDSTGKPSLSATAYGGSALTDYTPPNNTAEWVWVTLSTPASAVVGDMVGVRVGPGAVAPDGSNFMTIGGNTSTRFVWGIEELITLVYTTAWTDIPGMPIAVKYDDGSVYGFTLGSGTFANELYASTTPDEQGGKFTLPFSVSVVAVRTAIRYFDASPPFTVTLYDSANVVLKSWAHTDSDEMNASSGTTGSGGNIRYFQTFACAPVSLSANEVYRIAVKPTGAGGTTALTLIRHLCDAESDKGWIPGGTAWMLTERTDAGAWSDVAAGVAPIGIVVDSITDPSAVGGDTGPYGFVG